MAPVAAVIAGLVARAVPTSKDPAAAPIDWAGLLLSAAGMATLVLGIIPGPRRGWGSTSTLATIAAGLVILGLFVAVESRMELPMLDVGLFRNPRFTAASGSITIGFFTLAGFTFLITQYFQFVKGYSPFGTGVRLLPVATSVAVASVVGTKLAVRIVGQVLLGGGGLGLVTAPATEAILGAVPTEKAGVGSAVNDATRLFGAALGVAVIGSVAASLYGSRLGGTLPRGLPTQAALAARRSVGGALVAARNLRRNGFGLAAQGLSASAIAAFLHSLAGACRVAGSVAVGGAVMAASLLPSRPTSPLAPDGSQGSQPHADPALIVAEI